MLPLKKYHWFCFSLKRSISGHYFFSGFSSSKSVILGDVYYKDAPQDSISGALQLGITTSVGSHSTDRDVLIQDFEIVESIYFPKCGTTQTSPHKFEDFRFKSYAPLAFRFFRDIFDISVQDFLNSIGAKPLVPMGNPGNKYFLVTWPIRTLFQVHPAHVFG